MNSFGKKIKGSVPVGGVLLEIKSKEPTVNSLRPGEICLYGGKIYVNDSGVIRVYATEGSGGGTGEANTASNVGVGGVGVFKQKTGVDLEFKNINAGSAKVNIVDDTANNEVDIDVVESQIDHGLLAGLGDDDHGQYIKVDGSRAFSGNIRTGGNWLSNDGDNEGVFVDASGYVGINKSTPQTILDVGGNAYIGNQAAGNYAEFEADGTLKFNGDATVWGRIEVEFVTGSTGNPNWTSYKAGKSALFPSSSKEIISGRFVLPGDYKEGSNIYVYFHWSPDVGTGGNVVFGYDYSWANENDSFGSPNNEEITEAAGSVADMHLISNFSAISGSGKKIDSVVLIDFYRDGASASDTYGGDVYLHRIVVRYEKDTLGSRLVNSK